VTARLPGGGNEERDIQARCYSHPQTARRDRARRRPGIAFLGDTVANERDERDWADIARPAVLAPRLLGRQRAAVSGHARASGRSCNDERTPPPHLLSSCAHLPSSHSPGFPRPDCWGRPTIGSGFLWAIWTSGACGSGAPEKSRANRDPPSGFRCHIIRMLMCDETTTGNIFD